MACADEVPGGWDVSEKGGQRQLNSAGMMRVRREQRGNELIMKSVMARDSGDAAECERGWQDMGGTAQRVG